MNLELNGEGQVLAVRVCDWPDADLSCWRLTRATVDGKPVEMKGDLFQHYWLRVGPVSRCEMIWFRQGPRLGVNQASFAEAVLPQIRWFVGRLGLLDPTTTPLFSSEPTAQNPWVGRFLDLKKSESDAVLLDARLAKVAAEYRCRTSALAEPLRHGRWDSLVRQMDRDLKFDLDSFLMALLETGHVVRTGDWNDETGWICEGRLSVRVSRPTVHTVSPQSPTTVSEGAPVRRLVDLIGWLRNLSMHPSWWVMSADEHDDWIRRDTAAGVLTMSDEEVELFDLLGEELPYVWRGAELSAWAQDRWGTR